MESNNLDSYIDLQQKLAAAKHSLFALNDNIRRIIGRNPKDLRSDTHRPTYETKRNDNDRQCQKISDLSKFKRRSDPKSVFNRLSAPLSKFPADESRPRLNSRVIRELPTRQEIVEAQGTDSESRARNRRMFGSLLGTLHKFCQEESRLKPKEDKKAQIEKKLEEQEFQERAKLKKERESLFMDRKRKHLEIRKLELKMDRLQDFAVWKSSVKHLRQHIRTKTKPYIYFRPRIMCKKTENLLSDSQDSFDSEIRKKRNAIIKELLELEKSLKINEVENDEFFEGIGYINNCGLAKNHTSMEAKDDSISLKRITPVISEINSKKGNVDCKENKSKILNESSLSSSVVVVKNLETNANKI